jgi:hypothetical protein
MTSDFPSAKIVNGEVKFFDGELVRLPKEYLKPNEKLQQFFKGILLHPSQGLIIGVDAINFNFIYAENVCTVGLIVNARSGAVRDNAKKYPNNKFPKEFAVGRIVKERPLMTFEDYIPREFVTQNIHELRNLNAKISSNIDELLNVQAEDEWEEKFDRADENVKKIFVASRLIKFILDNVKFYIPDYIKSVVLDKNRSFRAHRSVSKIVKIYRNDFKKKKSDIAILGDTNRVLAGDRKLFELLLRHPHEQSLAKVEKPI